MLKTIKVSLFYPVDSISKPITYHLIKDFDLQINILHADINLNKTGKLIIDISGDEENIENGLEYIQSEGIKYKVFSKTIIWQEDNCIHCGACTAVCPSRALQMDTKTWNLTFIQDKCLACELCVKACPLNVMCTTF